MRRRFDDSEKSAKHPVLSWFATAVLSCLILLLLSTAGASPDCYANPPESYCHQGSVDDYR